MGFLDKLVPASKRGEKNMERARRAEVRGDKAKTREYYEKVAQAFDEHFAKTPDPMTGHMAMAGIAYARLGRNQEAVQLLEKALEQRSCIPDAVVHAGFAYLAMDDPQSAIRVWKQFPKEAEQSVMARALKDMITQLESANSADFDAIMQEVARAWHSQAKYDDQRMSRNEERHKIERIRGY